MKNKIFTIGGAVLDLFVKTHDQAIMNFKTTNTCEDWLCMKHGGKIKVEHVIETFGGGATNTAIGFSRMGFDVSFIGKIGASYGDRVIDNLKKNGVETAFVKMTKKDKTSFSTIISSFDGERTVLSYPGANRFFNHKDLPMEALAEADWIFLNHLTEEDSQIPAKILQLLKAHPHIKLAWNPGSEQISQGIKKWKALLDHTEILFVNKQEASSFARTPYQLAGIKREDRHLHTMPKFLPPYADDVTDILLKFFETGVKNVLITDGRNGAQASDGKKLYFCPVAPTKRIDSLGAGDAFASGFTSGLALGKGLKVALLYGTLNASSVVCSYGAQAGLLTSAGMEKRLKQSEIKVSSTRLLS